MSDESFRQSTAPLPIEVETAFSGQPRSVLRDQRRQEVMRARNLGCSLKWWLHEPDNRQYFELIFDRGSQMTVYQDLASGRWFQRP